MADLTPDEMRAALESVDPKDFDKVAGPVLNRGHISDRAGAIQEIVGKPFHYRRALELAERHHRFTSDDSSLALYGALNKLGDDGEGSGAASRGTPSAAPPAATPPAARTQEARPPAPGRKAADDDDFLRSVYGSRTFR